MENFIGGISNYMSYLVARRDATSNNIANANTPGYKAKSVSFLEQLENVPGSESSLGAKKKLYQTNPKHFSSGNIGNLPYEVQTANTQVNLDGNGVDTTEQMVDLVKANQLYSISIRALNGQFAIDQAARGK
ncbi:flagellar basal body rod protein FlgB [Microbacteriaceae bacterium 4G12]